MDTIHAAQKYADQNDVLTIYVVIESHSDMPRTNSHIQLVFPAYLSRPHSTAWCRAAEVDSAQPRGTQRFTVFARADEHALTKAVKVLAAQHAPYGYRRIIKLLKRCGVARWG